MITIRRKTKINKVLSVILVYAFLLIELIPFSRAMGNIEFSERIEYSFYGLERLEEVSEEAVSNETELDLTDPQEVVDAKGVLLSPPSMPGLPSTGPGQAESGFSIGSTDGMVNKFTGDFSYSLPLMDVEGYPIVLSYNSNVNMLQDASWVGLGWNLNVGAISREMRGIPDEFNGQQDIVRTHNEIENSVNGDKDGGYLSLGGGSQGASSGYGGSAQLTLLFGNYTDAVLGLGKTIDIGLGGQFSINNGSDGGLFVGLTSHLGFNYDSKKGIGTSQSIGLSGGYGKKEGIQASGEVSFGQSTNSRYGLLQKTISVGASGGYNWKSGAVKDELGKVTRAARSVKGSASYSATSSISYGTATMIPRIQFSSTNGSSDNFQFDTYFKLTTGGGFKLKAGYIHQDYSSTSFFDINTANYKMYQPAYGYMHSGKRAADNAEGKFPVMDFNRGHDSEFSEEMKNLPFSVQTHDIFYVNASGVGATFRPQRRDYGTYYDPNANNTFNKDSKLLADDDQTNVSVGFVIDASKSGFGIGVGYGSGTIKGDIRSGNQNTSVNILSFASEGASSNPDQAVYYRSVGEHTPVNMAAWNTMNGNTPDYYDVNNVADLVTQDDYLKVSGQTVPGANINSTVQSNYSATVFSPQFALDLSGSTYLSLPREGSSDPSETIQRLDGSIRQANHISSIGVVTPNGIRYRYGIPVYNYSSNEISFAVGESGGGVTALPTLPNEGMVVYNAGDNSLANTHGRTHYFDKTAVPAYPHSFLLTEMTSSDYIDRTNDGPTLDDMGTWYKFNHTRLYSDFDPYKWRFPISGGTSPSEFPQAKLSRGVLGSSLDDMGHYSYGEKEIWYTHSVESKNFIAVFYLGDRQDMYSVSGEDGILDLNKPLQRLEKIVLYNRSEWIKGQDNPANEPLPIQTIEFTYDYTLCPGSPGNPNTYSGGGQSGKLTLKEIRIYGGNSKEAGLSNYSFDYGDDQNSIQNPQFNYYDVDAWGCYKPNNIETPNDVYPYSIQDETEANNNIQAWKLKAVDNPAGGRLEIVYEADRYETVQQRRAMRHFNIFGMVDLFRLLKMKELSTWNPGTAISDQYNFHHEYGDLDGFVNELGLNAMTNSAQKNVKKKLFKEGSAYYMEKFGAFDFEAVPQNAVIFKLDEAISGTTLSSVADQMVKDDYFKAPSENPNAYLKDLLLKVYVNIKDDEVVEELVPLIADISSNYPDAFNNLFNGYFNDEVTAIGVMPKTAGVDEYEYGYVIIDPINTGDREEVSGDGADKVEKGSLVINPMQLMSMQFARQFLLDKVYGSCDGCDTDLSIDWKVFFGQDMYEYMIKDGGYAQDLVTNGGGASKLSTMRLFEPDNVKFGGNARVKIIRYLDNWDQISGEYNSEYVWNYKYTKVTDGRAEETGVASFEGRSGADENTLYAWDSYVNLKKKFPDERKFTPTPIAEQLYPIPLVGYSHVEVDFSSAVDYGHSESEFHTYKEDKYRTKSESTGIDKDTYIKKRNILSGVTADLYGYTQGYVVQTNDFHGKPSETRLYDGQGELISRSSYDYFELGENVPMVDRRGIVTPENIAIEYDIHADARFVSDKTVYNGIDFGLEFLYIPPAGFCITPSFGFSRSSRERGFYSHALIKHINYSAVLKGITSEYLGSVNHAQNLLFDKYTGQPILTSLNDEFNDELFSMSYPSHWRYRELRERNKIENLGLTVTLDPNSVFIPTADDIITPGDFVRFNNGPTLYVAQNYPAPANDEMFFIDAQGVKFTSAAGTYIVDILISGRDNRLMEPMQKVVSKTSPFDENLNVLNPPTNILSSYAVNYRNRLNVACGIPCDEGQGNNNELTFGSTYNPYVYGIRGDLVVDAQLAWQDDRVNLADLHGIRRDGAFSDYSSFYDLNTTEERWVSIDNPAHPNNVTTDPLQKWRRLSEITTFDKFGKILESKDQIDVHSSILYGYSNKYTLVPVAQAVNARQSDIAFDGFEDYTYFLIASDKTCPPAETHFDFTEQIDLGQGIYVTHDEKHSGLASLQVPATLSVTVGKEVGVICSALDAVDSGPDDFLLDDECACILPFEPSQGKYILGAWIKQGEGLTGGRIVVSGSGLTSSVNMYPTGNILDGWQRVEGRFEITGVAGSTINVTLENQNPSDVVYFDDLRIHPFLAGMKTMVYDPKSLLPLATHDGYNFTTFYNYDENLNQVRVRVETIEGIRTVVENEFGGQKKY